MSTLENTHEPVHEAAPCDAVELAITARPRDLGGFIVRRVLPSVQRRAVGPFLFFDHMGPVRMPVGEGLDVRPHPHIALATVTYLFEGEIMHRDSLGSHVAIRPGDVNWMVAGRGIVHSERSDAAERARGVALHGIQSWLALPLAHEETEPSFAHHGRASLPHLEREGVALDVIAGSAFGHTSPVGVFSRTLYVHALCTAGARLTLEPEHEERAFYVVDGEVACAGKRFGEGTLAVLAENQTVTLEAVGPARLMLLGGDKLDAPRHMFWNFVSSSEARLERAKADWRAGNFPEVPGDDHEFIPLPPG